jgi:hypothetical protein
MVMGDSIWDDSNVQIAWTDNNDNVFSVATKEKIATVRNGELYSLQGEPLNIHLQSRGVGVGNADALRRLKELARGSAKE